MANTNAYRTTIERTIEKMFYHKELTPAQQKIEDETLRKGWVEEERKLWVHTISADLGGIYASLQKVMEEIRTKKMLERIGKIREKGNSSGRIYTDC